MHPLSDRKYVLERSRPRPGEVLYLHLSDLALALHDIPRPTEGAKVLDFGSGGSPYRDFLGVVDYKTADFEESGGMDFPIRGDGRIEAESSSFEMLLSTQVLEHVSDVGVYLSECQRLLRPGGILVLTTHGTFEDHPCPHDYRRWTAEGIRQELTRHAFEVVKVKKLTTEARALAFLLRTRIGSLGLRRAGGFGWLFWLLGRVLQRFCASFDRWCDRHLSSSRVVPDEASGHRLYVGVLAIALKRS